MNAVAYFEIQADETARAVGFYRGVFGWTFERAEGLPIEYWRITTDGVAGGLYKRPAQTPPPECGTNAFICAMEVADFDATAEVILKHGGRVAMPKFAVPGLCWQGYFLDPDSNVFGVFQPDPNAR